MGNDSIRLIVDETEFFKRRSSSQSFTDQVYQPGVEAGAPQNFARSLHERRVCIIYHLNQLDTNKSMSRQSQKAAHLLNAQAVNLDVLDVCTPSVPDLRCS